jgi:hypothetical protein
MRTISNDYRDAQVLNLGSGGARGPYLITQTGIAPRADSPRTRMYILRPDGQWVDFNAYASLGKPEKMDELVFEDMAQVMQLFGRLAGPVRVLDLPVDKAGLEAWLARQKDRNPLEAAREWAAQYRARHSK